MIWNLIRKEAKKLKSTLRGSNNSQFHTYFAVVNMYTGNYRTDTAWRCPPPAHI